MSDYRNEPIVVRLKHHETVIALQMIGAGAYVLMTVTQGDKTIEAHISYSEIEDLKVAADNMDIHMDEWNS
jgi:hypothetical protein